MTAHDHLSVQPVKEPGKPPHVLLAVRIPGLDVTLSLAPEQAVEIGTYLLRAAGELLPGAL